MDGWRKLARAVVATWITSDDPMYGQEWALWCSIAGLDPVVMRKFAADMQKRLSATELMAAVDYWMNPTGKDTARRRMSGG